MSKIDLLSYVAPDPAWAQNFCLAIAGGGQPNLIALIGKMIWEMKSLKGFPWDGNPFDNNWIYQLITEWNWTDPTAFKMFTSSSWPGVNGAIPWMPRWLTLGAVTPPVITADSSYRIYPGGSVPFVVKDLGGPIETSVQGPFEGECAINFGGSIGVAQSTIRQIFKWGPGFMNMEVNHYAKVKGGSSRGRVKWELWQNVGGQYVHQKESLFNTEMPLTGGLPALNFPLQIPPFEAASSK